MLVVSTYFYLGSLRSLVDDKNCNHCFVASLFLDLGIWVRMMAIRRANSVLTKPLFSAFFSPLSTRNRKVMSQRAQRCGTVRRRIRVLSSLRYAAERYLPIKLKCNTYASALRWGYNITSIYVTEMRFVLTVFTSTNLVIARFFTRNKFLTFGLKMIRIINWCLSIDRRSTFPSLIILTLIM